MRRTWRSDSVAPNTLFSGHSHAFTEADLLAYAKRSLQDPETLAHKLQSPKRQALLWVVAFLTISVDFSIEDQTALAIKVFHNMPLSIHSVIREWDEKCESAKLGKANVNEEIAAVENVYHAVGSLLKELVGAYVEDYIQAHQLTVLKQFNESEAPFTGVVGGVAGGKTAAKKRAEALHGGEGSLFVSSDEWHDVLVKTLAVVDGVEYSEYQLPGKTTLPEAWFIKEKIWELLADSGKRPHVVQEAMDLNTLKVPDTGAVIYISTADPIGAIDRAEIRGDEIQRYVSSAGVVKSYQALWGQLLRAIQEKRWGTAGSAVVIHVYDSDLLHSKAQAKGDPLPIATIANGMVIINSLSHFKVFIARGHMLNTRASAPEDVLLNAQVDEAQMRHEVDQLVSSGMRLIYQNRPVRADQLAALMGCAHHHLGSSARLFQPDLAHPRLADPPTAKLSL